MTNFCPECGANLKHAHEPRTFVNVVLDESGSMGPIRGDTIGGFQGYIDGLRETMKENPQEYRVTLTKFSTWTKVVHENTRLSAVTSLEPHYRPNGGTALYDAIGKSLAAVEREAGPQDKVLTVIITDGQENSSIDWSKSSIKSRIETLTGKGNYTFVFLGADVDAMHDGGAIGIAAGNTFGYNRALQGQTMRGMASSTAMYAASPASATTSFVADFMEPTDDTETTS